MDDVQGTLNLKQKGTFTDSWPAVNCRYVADSNRFSYDSPQAKGDGKVLRVERRGSGLTKRGHRFDVFIEGNGKDEIALSAASEGEMQRWCGSIEISLLVRQRLGGTSGTRTRFPLLVP